MAKQNSIHIGIQEGTRAQQPLDRRSNGWDASAVEREREVVFFK